MEQNNNIKKLEYDEEFLLESAEKRFETGDYLGALTMLNKRGEKFGSDADASALYADIYEALGLWHMCADAWFRFLDTCNSADFSEGYEGLAVAFLNMGDVFQSDFYYRRAFDGAPVEMPDISVPHLRLVHSDDGSAEELEYIHHGIECLRVGDLSEAKKAFSQVPPESKEYPSASGLIAMCMLLKGDVDGAAEECEKLLAYHPENVHALTTYCGVLSTKGDVEGSKKVAKQLAALEITSAEDLFRVSTVLCETGLDEEAYEKLVQLKDKLPYMVDVLWFYAVASYRTGRLEEAISSLEKLVTVYPRKVIAAYYLVCMRKERDGEKPVGINYLYRLPDDEYNSLIEFFSCVMSMKNSEIAEIADVDFTDKFRLAFDHLDGRDDNMQMHAIKAAMKLKSDVILREILLDFDVDEAVKLYILRDLTIRNEDDSFGVVICNLYKEFFIHKLMIGSKKRAAFLRAFADVYAKFVILEDENEEKILTAAEDIYDSLAEAEALDLCVDEAAVSAAIYREARLAHGERSIEKIAFLFDANVYAVEDILSFII